MSVLFVASTGFAPIDWAIVSAYLIAMIATGMWFAHRQKTVDDYLLGGRHIPMWAAAVSIVATSVSAATFLGAPENAYTGNLTYLATNIAGMLAAVIVAVWFVPVFYRSHVTTVYELLGQRFGPEAARMAGGVFVMGRLLASGARLFMVAIPVSLIIWGDSQVNHMLIAVGIVSVVSIAYTLMGGLSAVIWTEVPQALLFVGAAVTAIVVLILKIPASSGDVWAALSTARAVDGSAKLTILDWRWDMTTDFNVWSTLFGLTLFNIAVYATDQDLAQRVLSCKSAAKGSWSAIVSQFIGFGVSLLFLCVGLLLYVFYKRPDLMGEAWPRQTPGDTRRVFLEFILNEMSPGLRGLMLAGLFAAAMSSVASSMGAVAATLINDFYRPRHAGKSDAHYVKASRWAVLVSGLLLGFVAAACVIWQSITPKGLLTLAIGIMLFAYTGLLAVFIAAVFTKRGNRFSVAAALATGFASVAIMQQGLVGVPQMIDGMQRTVPLSLGWQMLIGTTLSLIVCVMGSQRKGNA